MEEQRVPPVHISPTGLYTLKQLEEDSPSRGAFTFKEEWARRRNAALLIQNVGKRLSLSKSCCNHAILYMHRFYMFHSITQFHWTSMAATSLFLALKVEDHHILLKELIKVTLESLHSNGIRAVEVDDDSITLHENVLVCTLGFVTKFELPHIHIIHLATLAKSDRETSKRAYFLASDLLINTTAYLRYKPTAIGIMCFYTVCNNSPEPLQWDQLKEKFLIIDKDITFDTVNEIATEYSVAQIYKKRYISPDSDALIRSVNSRKRKRSESPKKKIFSNSIPPSEHRDQPKTNPSQLQVQIMAAHYKTEQKNCVPANKQNFSNDNSVL